MEYVFYILVQVGKDLEVWAMTDNEEYAYKIVEALSKCGYKAIVMSHFDGLEGVTE